MAFTLGSRGLWALSALLVLASLQSTGAYDPLDPYGNIAVKWDITAWTGDGYVAVVSMYNTQQFRGVQSYHLGWTWQKKEVIDNMIGAQATMQGDCTGYAGPPYSCERTPDIIDLVSGVPYAQQVANCCRNGVISAYAQDVVDSVSSFQMTVGYSGNTNISVLIPTKLTFKSPGPGYTCSDLKKVAPTKFQQNNGLRTTQAYLTWNATCTYSQYLARKSPSCCVSLSAFYSPDIVTCPTCACSCSPNVTQSGINVLPGTDQTCISTNTNYKNLPALENGVESNGAKITPPQLYCTNDMCPVKVHWHIKQNYVNYWRAKVTVTNRNFQMNYSDWNIVVQHQNFLNFTEAFSFTYKPLTPYGDVVNDTAMFWGVKYYNEMLLSAGPEGNVQSELLFAKDSSFTWANGWGFPTRIYFNGDDCVFPEPDAFPQLPNGGHKTRIGLASAFSLLLATVLSICLSM